MSADSPILDTDNLSTSSESSPNSPDSSIEHLNTPNMSDPSTSLSGSSWLGGEAPHSSKRYEAEVVGIGMGTTKKDRIRKTMPDCGVRLCNWTCARLCCAKHVELYIYMIIIYDCLHCY